MVVGVGWVEGDVCLSFNKNYRLKTNIIIATSFVDHSSASPRISIVPMTEFAVDWYTLFVDRIENTAPLPAELFESVIVGEDLFVVFQKP